jgi:hypothetical protein
MTARERRAKRRKCLQPKRPQDFRQVVITRDRLLPFIAFKRQEQEMSHEETGTEVRSISARR